LIHRADLPKRLAIVGGGYLGVEFAAIYRRFGSQVTLFESGSAIFVREDDDIAAVAEKILVDEGIEIVTGANITEVRDGDIEATIVYMNDGREQVVTVDAVLAAACCKPANGNSISDRTPPLRTTRYPRACTARYSTSAVFPAPGSPCTTTAWLSPKRTVASNLSRNEHSARRPISSAARRHLDKPAGARIAALSPSVTGLWPR
jgi:hypothetical protein